MERYCVDAVEISANMVEEELFIQIEALRRLVPITIQLYVPHHFPSLGGVEVPTFLWAYE
jgi:hypothetical protein